MSDYAALVSQLVDPDPGRRREAVEALGSGGGDGEGALAAALPGAWLYPDWAGDDVFRHLPLALGRPILFDALGADRRKTRWVTAVRPVDRLRAGRRTP